MRLPGFKICMTLFFLFFVQRIYAQSYGLGFYSHDVVQDKRTALQLNTGSSIRSKDHIRVSFDMSFHPNHTIYFGYILRLISDNNQNIDLVYDNQYNTKHFKIIIGERLSKIEFNIDNKLLYDQWNRITIDIDFKKDRISLTAGNAHFSEAGIRFKQGSSYKLLFGANTYKQFQTTDLPPMKLRDVKVFDGDQLACHWPLSEYSGNIASELVNRNNGVVTNPMWIKSKHRNWQLEEEMTVPGIAGTAFNAKTEQVYLVTADSLITYSVNQTPALKGTAYHSGRQNLVPGNQSVYDGKQLYYLFPDQKAVAAYDFKSQKWDQQVKNLYTYTNYGHLNKFFSSSDTALYLIGGYGQLIYKDSVSRFSLNTHTWQNVKTHGDDFTPRYLAGLGTTIKGDTSYILGGYGSASGQQILNPRNLYDMVRFTARDKKFKRLFTLDVKGEDFVFANSLVVHPATKSYYGLIFPQHKYNSRLQLIAGSLSGPSYKLVGNTIPFLFHDVNSFADLYYCAHSGKFLAVTLFKDNNKTRIKIYSLLCPPEPLLAGPVIVSKTNTGIWIICFFAAALTGYLIFQYRRRNKGQEKKKTLIENVAVVREQESIVKPVPVLPVTETKEPVPHDRTRNAIYLFGDLQLFTADGTEITRYFTPLLKELFLVILLYSIKWDRGVSSEKLNEVLWFDKTEKSARNNRSVNIAKLKSQLEKMGCCHLSKDTGYWKIEIDRHDIFIDYQQYLNIVSDKNKLDKQKITQLTQITQRGNFLSNIEYEWLDAFKSEVSNEIIDSYLQFADSVKIADDPEFLIKLANDIFYFDPANEEAMVLKCKTLSYLGKHSLAKTTFENFNKEYRIIYGENFEKDFHAVIG